MPLTIPDAPAPCVGSYTLRLFCGDPNTVAWEADVGLSRPAGTGSCGGGLDAVTAAVMKGWPVADVLKLVAALKK